MDDDGGNSLSRDLHVEMAWMMMVAIVRVEISTLRWHG